MGLKLEIGDDIRPIVDDATPNSLPSNEFIYSSERERGGNSGQNRLDKLRVDSTIKHLNLNTYL